MPPVVAPAPAAAGTGSAAAARLAHAAHVVVPSAICAPHVLQNAIRDSSSVAKDHPASVSSVSSGPGGVGATYQKNPGKAICIFAR